MYSYSFNEEYWAKVEDAILIELSGILKTVEMLNFFNIEYLCGHQYFKKKQSGRVSNDHFLIEINFLNQLEKNREGEYQSYYLASNVKNENPVYLINENDSFSGDHLLRNRYGDFIDPIVTGGHYFSIKKISKILEKDDEKNRYLASVDFNSLAFFNSESKRSFDNIIVGSSPFYPAPPILVEFLKKSDSLIKKDIIFSIIKSNLLKFRKELRISSVNIISEEGKKRFDIFESF